MYTTCNFDVPLLLLYSKLLHTVHVYVITTYTCNVCEKYLIEIYFTSFGFLGPSLDWCKFWVWNGNFWIFKCMSSSWFSQNHGSFDSPWSTEEQQGSEKDQEEVEI